MDHVGGQFHIRCGVKPVAAISLWKPGGALLRSIWGFGGITPLTAMSRSAMLATSFSATCGPCRSCSCNVRCGPLLLPTVAVRGTRRWHRFTPVTALRVHQAEETGTSWAIPRIRAALRHFNRWLGAGPGPPPQARIEFESADRPTIGREHCGNALGGIRLPDFAVPTGEHRGNIHESPPG